MTRRRDDAGGTLDKLRDAGLGRVPNPVVAARVGVSVSTVQYYCAQEGLDNVWKHERCPKSLSSRLAAVDDWCAYVARILDEHEHRVMRGPVTEEVLESEKQNWPLYQRLINRKNDAR